MTVEELTQILEFVDDDTLITNDEGFDCSSVTMCLDKEGNVCLYIK